MRLRFPKSARLTETSEFYRVKKDGRAFHGRYIILGVYRERASTRFGLVTSRRVGNAVVRNRLRRRFREMIRVSQPRVVPGVWIVIVVKPTAARASGDSLRSDFIAVAMRAAIFIEL